MPSEQGRLVREFVKSLPQRERYVVLMHYADRLTSIEIGLVLDMSTAAVDETLDRFRGRLDKHLHRRQAQPKRGLAQPAV